MHHLVWHTLFHLGAHLTQHFSRHRGQHSAPSCARCQRTEDLKVRNCCKVVLCESCSADWRRATAANDYRCAICDKDIVGG